MFGLKKLFRQVDDRLQALENTVAASAENREKQTEELERKISELSKAANRHDMAVEDLLESWEEMQEQHQEEKNRLSDALAQASSREREQSLARENALLNLTVRMQDMLFGLHRAALESGSDAWKRQFFMADVKIEEMRLPAGFQVVDSIDVPVDYAIHEITEAVPTREKEKDHTIKEIFSCGYIYMGHVLRKAQVTAYKYIPDDSN